MIYIVLGTKAQMVKMAPVMLALANNNLAYFFIFTGQHHETIDELRDDFGVKAPDLTLYSGRDITRISQIVPWACLVLWRFWKLKKKIMEKRTKNIFLVHGDTITTVLGSIMGRLTKSRVAHLESGLRSFKIFNPFPEELQRLATFRLSNIYFTPGQWALANLKKYSGEKIDIHQNTLLDTLILVKNRQQIMPDIPLNPFCLVSVHRFENISTRRALRRIIGLIERVAERIAVIFVLHPPTLVHLKKFKLYDSLENNKNIELRNRYVYTKFIKLLLKSEFVITDGGSNQEECYYLGHPCLLLRQVTERHEGLGKNVVISKYDPKIIDDFVKNYNNFRYPPILPEQSPSQIIIDYLKKFHS